MGQLSDREHTELLLLYKNVGEDIDREKREQWSHFYAILLAQGGVTGLSTLAFRASDIQSAQAVYAALVGLLLLGLLVLTMHQVRLARLRRFAHRCSEALEPHTRRFLESTEAESLHRRAIPALMVLVMLVVFGFLAIVALPQDEEEQPVPTVAITR